VRPAHSPAADALVKALQSHATAGRAINWKEFSDVVRNLPRARGQRVQWVRSLRLEQEVALLLEQGDFFDGLSGLRSMTDEQAEQHVESVCTQLASRLRTLLTSKLRELRDTKPMTAQQFKNTKFLHFS
jgi:hypothetical protein